MYMVGQRFLKVEILKGEKRCNAIARRLAKTNEDLEVRSNS